MSTVAEREQMNNQLYHLVTKKLRQADEEEKAKREPSGKLAASQLGKPLLEQVLKLIGVAGGVPNDYSLRLFARGNQVEAWAIPMHDLTKYDGDPYTYRGALGYPDAFDKNGRLYEIKSMKNSQVRWLMQEGPKWSHKLQAGMYALATARPEFSLLYVTADDLRSFPFELNINDQARKEVPGVSIKQDVERIITEVYSTLQLGQLPAFEPREKWHEKPEYAEQYSDYPDWINLTPRQMMDKLKRQYPDAYKKLKGFK